MNRDPESKQDSQVQSAPNPSLWGIDRAHWPTVVTSGRIAACIPFIACYLLLQGPLKAWSCTLVFVFAAISDWLDGYLARRWNAQSTMGKFLDPVADKVLVLCVLILFSYDRLIHPVLPILILSRDILIGGIRSVAAADRVVIDAKATGKWKTAVQMVAIPFVLIGSEVTTWFEAVLPTNLPSLEQVGSGLLWMSALLSLVSGWEYIQIYRQSRRSA